MKNSQYKKWNIVIVDLNPVRGSEMSKVRPCLVVSPNAMNGALHTVIIVPITSVRRNYPWRLPSLLSGVKGELCFDQIKTVDKSRIIKRAGNYPVNDRPLINAQLAEIFGEE